MDRLGLRALLAACIVLVGLPFCVFCEDVPSYPEIEQLNRRDPLFRQLSEEVTVFYQKFHRKEKIPEPLFFLYSPKLDEDLYSIAARTNLGFATIATLNHLDHPESLKKLARIILPSQPGLFVPLQPASELEFIMLAIRSNQVQSASELSVGNRLYRYLPGETFHHMERAFFWNILFRFPLERGDITSAFGKRAHPFTGSASFHNGIDIASPGGIEVLAAREGKVLSTGWDDNLGNYLVLSHEAGYQTVYGHLENVSVRLNQRVNSGSIIGTVGSTGISTGPHLHFEIRRGGEAKDPVPLLH